MQVLFLLSIFLTSGCVTKLLMQLPKEQAVIVDKHINEAENHYQTTIKYSKHLDVLYKKLSDNMTDQYVLQLSVFQTFADMIPKNHTQDAVMKEIQKLNRARGLKEEKATKIQKNVDLLEADLNISYNKAIEAHYEAKKYATLYWFDEKIEENQRKKINALRRAMAYKRKAQKQKTYGLSWIEKSTKIDDIQDSTHTYMKYFPNMNKAFESYKESIKYRLLEIQYLRQQLKGIRKVYYIP